MFAELTRHYIIERLTYDYETSKDGDVVESIKGHKKRKDSVIKGGRKTNSCGGGKGVC